MKGLRPLLLVLLGCAVYVETQLTPGRQIFSSLAGGLLVGYNLGSLMTLRLFERSN